MQSNERFNDWLFRYQFIYRSRLTEKSKQRFLKALTMDLAPIREDIQVIEYDHQKKYALRNVYVGDLQKAERIICTYYDTPPQHFGSYFMFNPKEQGRRTTRFILFSSIIALLVGILGTILYTQFAATEFVFLSIQTVILGLMFGLYFTVFGRITKGIFNQKNLIRNTSSIVALLKIISETKDSKVAFAFIDEGSYGTKGMDALVKTAKKTAQIFYLDSIGANAPLHALGTGFNEAHLVNLAIDHRASPNQINYLLSAEISMRENQTQFYLDKKELTQKKINNENVEKVVALLTSGAVVI